MIELLHLSLFSGIGGIDLAAEWAGFKTTGQVEINPYCIKVLEKHFPDVKRWTDVRKLKGDEIIRTVGRPTLISGGFPCQPHSTAGKRKASCDDRDLWPEFRRIVCEVKPRWVLGENVAGLRSSEAGRFFGGILGDLAAMGYSIGWGSWEAADVGAPHHRERIFVIAHLCSERLQRLRTEYELSQTIREVQTIRKDRDASDCHDPTTTRQRENGGGVYGITESKGSDNNYWKGQSWFEVATRLCRVDDGVSNRVHRLTALGNAVVPQQVYPILKAIAEIETVE